MPKNPHDKPIEAVAENGEILMDGPEGMAESFTPSAAKRSAEHIAKAVAEIDEMGDTDEHSSDH
ncbi:MULTISPECIES: hypothetical protein [Sphingomonas]|uniref:hypothetical protein n=1 Tax=Sphingomonas TaxID=13687 RepID=UPI0024135655|nr:hypothetical protein [Sphingomonas echinoides]